MPGFPWTLGPVVDTGLTTSSSSHAWLTAFHDYLTTHLNCVETNSDAASGLTTNAWREYQIGDPARNLRMFLGRDIQVPWRATVGWQGSYSSNASFGSNRFPGAIARNPTNVPNLGSVHPDGIWGANADTELYTLLTNGFTEDSGSKFLQGAYCDLGIVLFLKSTSTTHQYIIAGDFAEDKSGVRHPVFFGSGRELSQTAWWSNTADSAIMTVIPRTTTSTSITSSRVTYPQNVRATPNPQLSMTTTGFTGSMGRQSMFYNHNTNVAGTGYLLAPILMRDEPADDFIFYLPELAFERRKNSSGNVTNDVALAFTITTGSSFYDTLYLIN